MTSRAVVFACVLAVAGCEKSSSGSGALGAEDTALLKDLPSGNVAIVGGNYMKLQNFMQSSMGKMVRDVGAATTGNEGMGKWMDCFAKFPKLRLVGGLALRPKGFDMRMVFAGMSVGDVTGCAKDAGFKTNVDGDGKFAAIEIPSMMMNVTQGYITLPDGSLYMRQSMSLGMMPSMEPTTRTDLEADVAKLGQGTAADDKALVELAAKADRNQTFWFAGSGAGTPIADKLGEIYGAIDIDNGIRADVTVQLVDSALADQAEQTFDTMKKMSDQLPPDVRGVIDQLKLDRKGDHLHVTAKISAEQLEALTKMGGMGRHKL